ncbi:MAG: hypothetical protein HRT66_00635 [Flavobacteriaceae bacterium]|nr:hypothetical protein [Flavobacteriaceae bacterium]
MKKLIFIFFAIISLPIHSQLNNYEDMAVDLSNTSNGGTARYSAMGGAFGSLGGDISALKVNPAGASVFLDSELSFSYDSSTYSNETNYYGNTENTDAYYDKINQFGFVLAFGNDYGSWTNTSFALSIETIKKFDDSYFAAGDSGIIFYYESPVDPDEELTQYDNTSYQEFSKTTKGHLDRTALTLASTYEEEFMFGVNFNFYDFKMNQKTLYEEINTDSNEDTLKANQYISSVNEGKGFSMDIGFIYIGVDNFKLGFSYKSPIIYDEIIEESDDIYTDEHLGETTIYTEKDDRKYYNYDYEQANSTYLEYNLKTPAVYTVSAAYIFGGMGLISVDYDYMDYSTSSISGPLDFSGENRNISKNYKSVNNIRVGGEIRLGMMSLRAGYALTEHPMNTNDGLNRDMTTVSGGFGFNFENSKIDFAISKSDNKDNQILYDLITIDKNKNSSQFVATYTWMF